MKKKAFTLVELLVVIAIIAVLVAILVPVIGSALAEARKGACQANLKTIGSAFREFERNKNRFGRLSGHTSGTAGATYTEGGTHATDVNAVAVAPMQEVWALIEAGYVPENAFKCGGDANYTVRTVAGLTLKYGWSADTQFSYGIQFPYDDSGGTASQGNPAIPTDIANGYAANAILMADMPTRADATPVVTTATDYQNHSDGIAYLTRAGNVGFNKPAGAANSVVNGDEIYQDAGAGAPTVPANSTDAVICPGAISS